MTLQEVASETNGFHESTQEVTGNIAKFITFVLYSAKPRRKQQDWFMNHNDYGAF